ncbi:hypothetical protein [Brevibacterium album]|uniref:hypothetical protein n=1 Tax=Brevibacterium album TaxID=417948 RepID=UPI000424B39D|nr:hypothetical protein [Brevibacterium album]
MDGRKPVLVIGGTGMLRDAVRALAQRGDTVLAAARRPARAAPDGPVPGSFIPVTAEWRKPEGLADGALTAMRDHGFPPASLPGAIAWVHAPHRQAVFDQLERVLSREATVLQLWGSAHRDPREVMAEETRTPRPWTMRHLLLGYRSDRGGSRWLTHAEISEAALRAWDGDDPYAIAGRLDPWEHRL